MKNTIMNTVLAARTVLHRGRNNECAYERLKAHGAPVKVVEVIEFENLELTYDDFISGCEMCYNQVFDVPTGYRYELRNGNEVVFTDAVSWADAVIIEMLSSFSMKSLDGLSRKHAVEYLDHLIHQEKRFAAMGFDLKVRDGIFGLQFARRQFGEHFQAGAWSALVKPGFGRARSATDFGVAVYCSGKRVASTLFRVSSALQSPVHQSIGDVESWLVRHVKSKDVKNSVLKHIVMEAL